VANKFADELNIFHAEETSAQQYFYAYLTVAERAAGLYGGCRRLRIRSHMYARRSVLGLLAGLLTALAGEMLTASMMLAGVLLTRASTPSHSSTTPSWRVSRLIPLASSTSRARSMSMVVL
jgi:hypothetical protein